MKLWEEKIQEMIVIINLESHNFLV